MGLKTNALIPKRENVPSLTNTQVVCPFFVLPFSEKTRANIPDKTAGQKQEGEEIRHEKNTYGGCEGWSGRVWAQSAGALAVVDHVGV